jgi:hypothetical protein
MTAVGRDAIQNHRADDLKSNIQVSVSAVRKELLRQAAGGKKSSKFFPRVASRMISTFADTRWRTASIQTSRPAAAPCGRVFLASTIALQ